MLYTSVRVLRSDARKVGAGLTLPQRQDSTDEQLRDLVTLANRFGMYDAADFIRDYASVNQKRDD